VLQRGVATMNSSGDSAGAGGSGYAGRGGRGNGRGRGRTPLTNINCKSLRPQERESWCQGCKRNQSWCLEAPAGSANARQGAAAGAADPEEGVGAAVSLAVAAGTADQPGSTRSRLRAPTQPAADFMYQPSPGALRDRSGAAQDYRIERQLKAGGYGRGQGGGGDDWEGDNGKRQRLDSGGAGHSEASGDGLLGLAGSVPGGGGGGGDGNGSASGGARGAALASAAGGHARGGGNTGGGGGAREPRSTAGVVQARQTGSGVSYKVQTADKQNIAKVSTTGDAGPLSVTVAGGEPVVFHGMKAVAGQVADLFAMAHNVQVEAAEKEAALVAQIQSLEGQPEECRLAACAMLLSITSGERKLKVRDWIHQLLPEGDKREKALRINGGAIESIGACSADVAGMSARQKGNLAQLAGMLLGGFGAVFKGGTADAAGVIQEAMNQSKELQLILGASGSHGSLDHPVCHMVKASMQY
jgi:hypothetical protein